MRKAFLGLALMLGLAACGGDPLRDVPRLSQVPMTGQAGQADVMAPDALADPASQALPGVSLPEAGSDARPDRGGAPRGGLLGFLKRKADAGRRADAPVSEAPVSGSPVSGSPVSGTPVSGTTARADDPDPAAQDASDTAEQTVALLPQDAPRRRGLFGGGAAPRSGPKPGAPDAREVSYGTTLPYGSIARVCGLRSNQLGRKTQSWPARGKGFTLYDSDPGSTGAHTFYLTGFKDGCARQVTAALVVFGAPETWEQIHYGPAGASLPVSAADRAYEGVKARFCRVGKGKPCGSRMGALSKQTVFVSVYEHFEDNTRWKNLLLHNGEVIAMDAPG